LHVLTVSAAAFGSSDVLFGDVNRCSHSTESLKFFSSPVPVCGLGCKNDQTSGSSRTAIAVSDRQVVVLADNQLNFFASADGAVFAQLSE
jgi:hypothetical protein